MGSLMFYFVELVKESVKNRIQKNVLFLVEQKNILKEKISAWDGAIEAYSIKLNPVKLTIHSISMLMDSNSLAFLSNQILHQITTG